ncbi:MAG: hypothetical protein ACE5H3_03610 [Planctomycetota bacterium]
MTIRLTLALLALTLVPKQDPQQVICIHHPPKSISSTNAGDCEGNNNAGCLFEFLFTESQNGNCQEGMMEDCYWVFKIKAQCSSDQGSICLRYLDDQGVLHVKCSQLDSMGNAVSDLIGVRLDCGVDSTNKLVITVKDANGVKLTRCKPKFSCGPCVLMVGQS